MSTSGSRSGHGSQQKRDGGAVSLAATAALAAVGAAFIVGVLTSAEGRAAILMIGVVAALQALEFAFATDVSLRYRIATAAALLALFAAALVPPLVHEAPLGVGPAVAFAVVGSLPMWAIAAWRRTLTRSARG